MSRCVAISADFDNLAIIQTEIWQTVVSASDDCTRAAHHYTTQTRYLSSGFATRTIYRMNQTIEIRPATRQDATTIADIYLTSRKQHLPFAPLAHSDEQVRGWIANIVISKLHTTVAEVDGEIVGFCSTFTRAVRWIDNLYLAPDWMGEGIGSALLKEAMGRLDRPIHLYTFQENVIARNFYEKHGFVAIEFGDGSGNEEGAPDVLYAL